MLPTQTTPTARTAALEESAPRVRVTPTTSAAVVAVDINVQLPAGPGLAARAAAVGVPALRGELTAACRDEVAVRKYRALAEQTSAAEKRVADAIKTFDRVRAAKVLLESNPSSDFANGLRAVIAELDAAQIDKQAAEADLELLRRPVPHLWPTAANAIAGRCMTPVTRCLLALGDEAAAAEARLQAGCEAVRALVERAVREHLAPVAAELLTLRAAADAAAREKELLVADVRAALVGATPAGVTWDGFRFVLLPPPAPPTTTAAEEPVTNPRQVAMRW